MRYLFFVIVILLSSQLAYPQSVATEYPEQCRVTIVNPLSVERENVLIKISSQKLAKNSKRFNPRAFVVMDGEKEIPSQYNDHGAENSSIVFVLDYLGARETRQVSVRFHSNGSKARTYPKRTQAELSFKKGGEWKNREYLGGAFQNTRFLRVPPEHKDHSWFIRYEGPGWESDKVGYRFYLDQRNATDVFGKVTRDMVLQLVGQDGFDSYHQMQPWGMDVMKVGKSLGIGSLGSFVNGEAIRVEKTDSVNCRIVEDGVVYSAIETNYYGWKIGEKKHDVNSRISIHAGTRISEQTINISNDISNVATGIVKDKLATLIKKEGDAQRLGYIATYGKQSLNADNLGLAVFFKNKDLMEVTDDTNSHVVKLKPSGGKLTYYFLAAWERELDGIKDQKEFENYLEKVALELANPVTIEVSIKK